MALFKFQPGHQKRIQKFIEDVKYLVKEKTRANESLKHKGQKWKALQPICHRSKAAKTDYEEEQPQEIYVMMTKVVIALSLIC